MRSARTQVFLITPVLALVLVLTGLLPPEHMHLAGIEGRTDSIIHRHSFEGSGSDPRGTSITGHGDHHRALFLSTLYDNVPRFAPYAPAVVDAAITIRPAVGLLESVQADDAHPVHGPPGSVRLTRAPPSFT